MRIKHKAPDLGARVAAWREQVLRDGFEWGGERFQVDAASAAAIARKATRVLHLPGEVEWRASSNRMVRFTADEFLAFAVAVDDYVESVMARSWAMK